MKIWPISSGRHKYYSYLGLEGTERDYNKRKVTTCERHGDGDFASNIRREKIIFRVTVY